MVIRLSLSLSLSSAKDARRARGELCVVSCPESRPAAQLHSTRIFLILAQFQMPVWPPLLLLSLALSMGRGEAATKRHDR